MNKCPHCGKYFGAEVVEESRLNSLYKTNNTAGWAREQLRILVDMAECHKLPEWYVKDIKRIRAQIHITV
jgi:hypothetical protein